jgi:hypothetical protein
MSTRKTIHGNREDSGGGGGNNNRSRNNSIQGNNTSTNNNNNNTAPTTSVAPQSRVKNVYGEQEPHIKEQHVNDQHNHSSTTNQSHKSSRGYIMGFLLGGGGSSSSSNNNKQNKDKNNKEKAGIGNSALPPMRETLESDEQLRIAFSDYAKTHYVNESLSFLQSVIEYQAYFWEKNDSWRKHKISIIYGTYIQVGSASEVNLSAECRKRCKHDYEAIMNSKHPDCRIMLELFKESERQVSDMIESGVWRKFITERRGREPSFGSMSTPE